MTNRFSVFNIQKVFYVFLFLLFTRLVYKVLSVWSGHHSLFIKRGIWQKKKQSCSKSQHKVLTLRDAYLIYHSENWAAVYWCQWKLPWQDANLSVKDFKFGCPFFFLFTLKKRLFQHILLQAYPFVFIEDTAISSLRSSYYGMFIQRIVCVWKTETDYYQDRLSSLFVGNYERRKTRDEMSTSKPG